MVRDPMATYKSSNSQMCACVSCFNSWQVAVRGSELHARSISIAIDYCDITYSITSHSQNVGTMDK